jgi:hypothetical protein
VNKIEQGVRNDVSISQLFAFAEVLGTTPINLLTPGEADAEVEISPGGRVLDALQARGWIRGVPDPDADELDYFFDLPVDEQRAIISRIVVASRDDEEPVVRRRRELWWYGQSDSDREKQIAAAIGHLVEIRNKRKEKQQ